MSRIATLAIAGGLVFCLMNVAPVSAQSCQCPNGQSIQSGGLDCVAACGGTGGVPNSGPYLGKVPIQELRPGTNDGSYAAAIDGGPYSARRHCNAGNATLRPSPLQGTVGVPVAVTFEWGRLGGGVCNIHSGGSISWGDTRISQLKTESLASNVCGEKDFPHLVGTLETLEHTYQSAGTFIVTGIAQGDFYNVGDGSFRCINRRQDLIVISSPVK